MVVYGGGGRSNEAHHILIMHLLALSRTVSWDRGIVKIAFEY